MGRDPSTPADDLRPEDSSSRDRSDDVGPADLDRLANLDDRLGGHAPADDRRDRSDSHSGETPPEGLDAILLLRQLAAAECGESAGERELPPRIGRFAVVREVGRGGFARVYEAFDTRLLRRVALKVARPEAVLSGGARRRFVREAELAARLVHPHVVTIHEAGEAGGHVYIAEEFCPGGDLGAWLERHPGPLPPRVAARLVHTLAGAVAHSHGFCILHRDIKPANVLLVPVETGALLDGDAAAPGHFDVKLADFGLGKLADPEAVDGAESALTRAGARIGTPAWMAPEQVDAAFGPVGPAADIHALGLLLDRLLTGRCAHAGIDEAETMRHVLTAEPVPADRVVRGVPADLGAVTAKCLAKHPVDRYATVADLAADLARFLDGRPTVARPVSPLGRAMRLVRRHRAVVAASALALAASMVALVALGVERHKQHLLVERAAEVRGLQAAATLRRGFESWRTGDVPGALAQFDACRNLDPQLADSLAGGWLQARLHGEEAILLEPDSRDGRSPCELFCVAVSPDGATVAAGGADGVLTLLGVEGDAVRRVVLHDEINDVAFSPDGARIASAGQDGRVCVCDVADGAIVAEWRCDDGPLFAVAWAPDGRTLACGGGARVVRFLTVADPTAPPVAIRPFEKAPATETDDAEIEALLFLAPDRLAAACGSHATIVDPRSGGIVHELVGHDGAVTHLAASPDGRLLVTAGSDRRPLVWDVERGTRLATLPIHPSWVAGCRFTADGGQVVTGCRDGVVRVQPLGGTGAASVHVGHVGRVWDVATLPDGRILSVGSDGTLRRWAANATLESAGVREFDVADEGIACALPVAAGEGEGEGDVLVALRDSGAVVRLAADGTVVATAPPRFSAANRLAVNRRLGRLAGAGARHRITTAPIPGSGQGDTVRSLPATLAGSAIAWSGDGSLLVGGVDGRLQLWLDHADRAVPIDDLGRSIDAIDVTAAGGARAVVVAGKTIRCYDLSPQGIPRAASARTLVGLPQTTGSVRVVSFAPDGASFVIGTNVGGVERYDTATGLSLGTFARHSSDVRALEWSPDGRTLVSADAGIVRFSDVRTTTVFDELRPGWTIESVRLVLDGGAATGIVVAGDAAEGDDRRKPGRLLVAGLVSR